MQTTKFDGTIDMNAIAAVLSLAPKNAEGVTDEAIENVRHLGVQWSERTREMAPTHDWDPWHADNK